MPPALLWFRHDLRLADNPALQALLEAGHAPVPVYIHDEPDADWPLGAASAWWLHHSLGALQRSLRERGSDLLVFCGDPEHILPALLRQTRATRVAWNTCFEPAQRKRDARLRRVLEQRGCRVSCHNAALLREPRELLKGDGSPYRVFTPFWKNLQRSGPVRGALPAAGKLPAFDTRPATQSLRIEALALLPAGGWDKAFYDHWQPGEAGAWQALQGFSEQRLPDYPVQRDQPARHGTSRLSPHLHFGEISPVQVWETLSTRAVATAAAGRFAATESYLRQLAWREFSFHMLYHFPATPLVPLDERFVVFPWRREYQADLECWQRGQTGIPLVDAGMRELWTTGYLHNRMRMVVASFLTKNLLIPWQEGARWFWDTLVDADLANNTMGWQWSAGCGVDAAPFYRIFNPVLQGERFDREGCYVRRWIPVLAKLGNRYLHRPWNADPAILAEAGIRLGRDYPHPLVDLQESRRRALTAWEQIRQQRRA